MDSLEKLIKRETNYMFSDVFYRKFTDKILSFVNENKHKDGFVYFIKNGVSGNKVKIGSAIDIDKRILSYQTAFHEKIFVLGYIKSDNYIFLENELHKTFSDKRIKGEWFEFDDLDIFSVKELYNFIYINDFYDNKIKIEKMNPKVNSLEFNEIFEYCKTLELNKSYRTSFIFKDFINLYPQTDIKNTSWFGREISKTFKRMGIKKIDSTGNGIRTFILK